MTVLLPENIVDRWQQALRNDRLIEWRALAFLLSAEAKLAAVCDQYATSRDLICLFETAMQHVYRLQPVRNEE